MSCKNAFSICQKRTKTEICLIVLIGCCTAVVIYLMVAIYAADTFNDSDSDDDDICVTPACVRSAGNILDKINEDVDPCDDFYEFVCGKFAKESVIPDEKTVISSFSLVRDKVNNQIKNIISEPLRKNDSQSLKLLKLQYNSCMNTTKIERDGLDFVKKVFKELGGWPVLESVWNEKKFDWKQLLYRLRRSGWRPVTFFIQLQIEPDVKNTSKRILTISQPDFPMYNILKSGFNDSNVQAYYEYLKNLAILSGASSLSASVEMKEVLLFEISLARSLIPNSGLVSVNSSFNAMTIKKLQETVHTIPWLQLINNYLAPSATLASTDTVNVASLDYFLNLEDLLLNMKKRIIANYMFLKLFKDSVPHLPQKFRYEEIKYLKVVFGKTRINSRWEQCVWEVDKLNVAASSVYVKKFVDKSYKGKIHEIAEDVKDAFLENLNGAKWIDVKTKKRALEKAEKISLFLGYPDDILDEEKVEDYYTGLRLNSKDYYLKMRLNISNFLHMKNVLNFKQVINKTDWMAEARSYVVNAFYNPRVNTIEVPAAIMQSNFFNPGRPQYMNYATIGEIIAHEIMHAFDDLGRQFDENNDLSSWWSPESLQIFREKSKCFIRQYNNITVSEVDMNLNGFHTLNENIADNGGFKIAYLGYLKWLERNHEEPSLPGLDYTPQQIFWISGAIDGCAKYRKQKLEQFVKIGKHAPQSFRILMSFRNNDDFGDDFNCTIGSNMNPEHKCQLW